MKKQTMSLAVASALLVGGTGTFAGMHVNDRGLGEVLIYPFYSAANGNDTYIHLVNTTDLVKAVKVRFIEAQNSQEVLDFNLYLSPGDEFAGAITANPNGTGALFRTVDNSCTVPELGTSGGANVGEFAGTQTDLEDGSIRRDQPFVNFLFNALPNVDRTPARTLEGYVEVIEMGQLSPDQPVGWNALSDEEKASDSIGKGYAAVHGADGDYLGPDARRGADIPADCGKLVGAWARAPKNNFPIPGVRYESVWQNDDPEDELLQPWEGGGLYGLSSIINVEQGTSMGADPLAIADFYDTVLSPLFHFPPGNELPDLTLGTTDSTIFNEGAAAEYSFLEGLDAVSSLMMSSEIINDYVIDPDLAALTDWVVTMPTKREYVNGTTPVQPFTNVWNGTGACEEVTLVTLDREEAFTESEEGADFSPQPPAVEGPGFNLCTEVSVISFGDESALDATSSIRYGYDPGYTEGWAALGFTSVTRELAADSVVPAGPTTFVGLPAIGFAVFNFVNGDVGGVLSNYDSAFKHKSITSVE